MGPPRADTSPGRTSQTYFSQRLRLHYVEWGNPAKPPLLLVHGGRDHCRNWDWTAAALRDDWHVIAPGLRGHRDSPWSTDGSYTMGGYIYYLSPLAHHQRPAPATLIAHSLGGHDALRSSATCPAATSRPCGVGSGARPCSSTARRAGRVIRRPTAAPRPSATRASSASSAPATGCTTTGWTTS